MSYLRPITLRLVAASMLLVFALGSTGCSSLSRAEKGAAAGAGAGAVIGGVIGKATGKTTRGVLIGTAVGGTAGAIIGRQMDKQAEELEQELEGASIARVGEGIEITFDSAILFDVDSDVLSSGARQNLDQLAASLKDYPNTDILIVGHTDATGSAEYNEKLSIERAESAAQYLMAQGIDANRLNVTGYGEARPVASNDSDTGRQQNRRVEVAIYASDEYRQQLESNSSGR